MGLEGAELGGVFKFIIQGGKPQRRGGELTLLDTMVFSLCNTAISKFYRMPYRVL